VVETAWQTGVSRAWFDLRLSSQVLEFHGFSATD
jgi:hypothetical protein